VTSVALPRPVAASITVHGLATTQRIIAVIGALIAAVIVIDVFAARGLADQVPLVIAPFLGIGVLALVMLWRPSVVTAVLFIAAGAVFTVAVPVLVLAADPQFDELGPYLLNRVAAAMCLVGAVSGRALNGVVWTVVAFVVAHVSLLLGLMLSDSGSATGLGHVIAFTISLAAYGTLALAQRQAERQLMPMSSAADEIRNADRRRVFEQRAAGIVHDTLLADLAALARAPGPVTPRMRSVLTQHLAEVAGASVADQLSPPSAGSALGDALRELAHEYQWSGVRVDVSGADALLSDVPSETRLAVVGATRAALDNVVKHARTDRAELVIGIHDRSLTVLVVDDGVGFATTEVGADRLGLRFSVEQRIAQVGGDVRIWSGPDGTTVMLTVALTGGEQ